MCYFKNYFRQIKLICRASGSEFESSFVEMKHRDEYGIFSMIWNFFTLFHILVNSCKLQLVKKYSVSLVLFPHTILLPNCSVLEKTSLLKFTVKNVVKYFHFFVWHQKSERICQVSTGKYCHPDVFFFKDKFLLTYKRIADVLNKRA